MAKKIINSTITEITKYWSNHSTIPDEELMIDWDVKYAKCHCWNCGDRRSTPQRAHIIPESLGGKDEPSNFVLLCGDCHDAAPDVDDKDEMWNWIKSNKQFFGFENTYRPQKALIAFKEQQGHSFLDIFNNVEGKDISEAVDFLNYLGHSVYQIGDSWFIEVNNEVEYNDKFGDTNEIIKLILREGAYSDKELIRVCVFIIAHKSIEKHFQKASTHKGIMSVPTMTFVVKKVFDECNNNSIRDLRNQFYQ